MTSLVQFLRCETCWAVYDNLIGVSHHRRLLIKVLQVCLRTNDCQIVKNRDIAGVQVDSICMEFMRLN